jgi:hypothetical protein
LRSRENDETGVNDNTGKNYEPGQNGYYDVTGEMIKVYVIIVNLR